jgi:uncharacterized phage protein (TIGR02218 family)
MKTIDAGLLALLAGNRTLPMADCFTFTLLDGTVIRASSLDVPVVVDGILFPANGIRVDGMRFRQGIGLEVDEQTVTIGATAADTVNGVPFLESLRLGRFDLATVQRDRAFFDPASVPSLVPISGLIASGSVTLFHGRISSIDRLGRAQAQVKVKSDLVLLNIDMPRNIFEPCCVHATFDSGCGLNKVDYATFGLVANGSTPGAIAWSGSGGAHPDGWWDQGTVTFTGGVNVGLTRTVKLSTNALLTLIAPLDMLPAAGDSFTVYAGDDHTLATCRTKFGNGANFRGFPFVPAAELAF